MTIPEEFVLGDIPTDVNTMDSPVWDSYNKAKAEQAIIQKLQERISINPNQPVSLRIQPGSTFSINGILMPPGTYNLTKIVANSQGGKKKTVRKPAAKKSKAPKP